MELEALEPFPVSLGVAGLEPSGRGVATEDCFGNIILSVRAARIGGNCGWLM